MNEDQEELFGQYVAEFALAHDLKLDDDDILKVVDLFDECTERWKTDVSVSIAEMASDLGFTEQDDHIMEDGFICVEANVLKLVSVLARNPLDLTIDESLSGYLTAQSDPFSSRISGTDQLTLIDRYNVQTAIEIT